MVSVIRVVLQWVICNCNMSKSWHHLKFLTGGAQDYKGSIPVQNFLLSYYNMQEGYVL